MATMIGGLAVGVLVPQAPVSGVYPVGRVNAQSTTTGGQSTARNPITLVPPPSIPAIWSDRWSAEAVRGIEANSVGRERVLIVDDCPIVRRLVNKVLSCLGYETSLANDGVEALTALERSAASVFSAVVTDVEMPHMRGSDFLREARVNWPKLPVLVHSSRDLNILEEELGVFIDDYSVFMSKNEDKTLIPRVLRRLIAG